jgi:hypothetical protein
MATEAPHQIGLAPKNLTLTPATSLNGDLSWICGAHSSTITGLTAAATPAEPALAQTYLPQVCRDGV